MQEFLNVGQIINTHGVKGEVKVLPLTDDIKRFRKLKTVLIDNVERNIVWCKLQNDKVILKIEGIETMDEAMKYRTKYLKIHRDQAVKLPEDTYFIADLKQCVIYDTNGEKIGPMYNVIKTGSNDVYWVKDGAKEVLIPAMKDFVTDIDIENKKITIRPVKEWNYED